MLFTGVILSFLVAKLRGGRLARLRDVRFSRLGWVLASGLLHVGLQWLGARGWAPPDPWAGALNVAGYGLLLYGVAGNLRLPGMGLVATGLIFNLAVIAANGGKMPVSARALERVGLAHLVPLLAAGESPTHTLQNAATRLGFLGDVFLLPRPFWHPCTFSLGDAVLLAGIFVLTQRLLGAGRAGTGRPARRRAGPRLSSLAR